jgi:hypothetical protein
MVILQFLQKLCCHLFMTNHKFESWKSRPIPAAVTRLFLPLYRKWQHSSPHPLFIHIFKIFILKFSPRFLCRPTTLYIIARASNVRAQYIRKTADLLLQLWISTFPRFVAIWFYFLSETLNGLYKSLHQSFFYSFITILPSESGVTLHYSTILP